MSINYTHSQNTHTVGGPQAVLPFLLAGQNPTSLLDVGCGIGTWLKAALDLGIADVMGIDGIDVRQSGLLIPENDFRVQDLTYNWNLGRRFDFALCLEVAEHLPQSAAVGLIDNLTRHSDAVAFSAACPSQSGDNHINCQWPTYWQKLFNIYGFRCSDAVRWQIWNDSRVEPWYRQNLFVAVRDTSTAGREHRLPSVIHPEMLPHLWMYARNGLLSEHSREINNGCMPLLWYFRAIFQAVFAKLNRKIGPHEHRD